MSEDKYPWRKQVQALLEEYELPIRVRGYVSPLTTERCNAIWHAIQDLPYEYQKVVKVLDCKDESILWLRTDVFPKWPRSLRQGLQKMLNVPLRTVDDWHAKALDQIAEALQLKATEPSHSHPRRPKRTDDEYREPRWPRPQWWDRAEFQLEMIGKYGFYINRQEYEAIVRSEHERAKNAKRWNRLVAGEPYAILMTEELYLPPNPKEERAKAQALVQAVLTDTQMRDLILDRYWDPQVNRAQHPRLSVKFYSGRLSIGRTQYYKVWTQAMEKIAAYWGIPIEEDGECE